MSPPDGGFTLPAGWRAAPAAERGSPALADVGFADLADGLAAVACGDLPVVLVTAHLAVLSMLGPEPGARTCVQAAGLPCAAVRLPRRRGTWASLAGQVTAALQAAGSCPGCGDVRYAAAAGTPSAAEAGQPGPPGGTRPGPGLQVLAGPEAVRLRADPYAVAPRHLQRLAGMYRAVLEALSRGADGDCAPAILPPGERDRVLRTWGRGPVLPRDRRTVVDLIRAQAAARPHAVAVRWDGGASTYRQLDAWSERFARRLRALRVGSQTPVGVYLRRGPQLLPVLLGIWKAGGAYLPLDVQLPGGRLGRILASASCPLVVTSAPMLPALSPRYGGNVLLADDDNDTTDRDTTDRPGGCPPSGPQPGDVAYILHTSGSTGEPKGVLVQHDGLVNHLLWTAENFAAHGAGGAPVFTSIGFDLGLPCLLTPLLTGQAVHLLPDPLPAADLGRQLARGAPYSFVKATPGLLDLLMHQLEPGEIRDLAGLMVVAGDAFPRALAQRWLELAGPSGPRLWADYGPTEITVACTAQPVPAPPATDLVPLGSPLPNTTVHVLDDRLEPVPAGVTGQIHVGGPGVARGYLGRPGLTADRFLPDPHGPPGARLYQTGDLGRWLPDGTVEFLGRRDDQVKIRGYRVELGEIRAALRAYPRVRDAAVITEADPAGALRPVAFVVAQPGPRPPQAALRAHLSRSLPEYMVPARIIPVDRIPLTGNGKTDDRALAAAACPSPERVSHAQAALWLLHQLAPASTAYHTGSALLVHGRLDPQALAGAVDALAARHDMVRSTFHQADGGIERRIHPVPAAGLDVVEVPDAGEGELRRLAQAAVDEPFFLDQGVFRFRWYQTCRGPSLMLMAAHHIATDALSNWVLLRDLLRLYQDYAACPGAAGAAGLGQATEPPPPAGTYQDFVRAEAELLASPRSTELEAYWRELCGGVPPGEIPPDRPRAASMPAVGTAAGTAAGAGATRWLRLGAKDVAGVRQAAAASEVTVFAFLLACFQALVARRGGQPSFLVGCPTSTRRDRRTREVVGNAVNTVLFRADLGPGTTFRELAERAQHQVVAGMRAAGYPFSLLPRSVLTDRRGAAAPLCRLIFNFIGTAHPEPLLQRLLDPEGGSEPVECAGLRLTPVALAQSEGQLDLAVHIQQSRSGMAAEFRYDSALFDAVTIDDLAASYHGLVLAAAENPDRPVAGEPAGARPTRPQTGEAPCPTVT